MRWRLPVVLLVLALLPCCAHVLDEAALLPGARVPDDPARRGGTTFEVHLTDGTVLRGHREDLPGARAVLLYFGGNGQIVGPRSAIFRVARERGVEAVGVNYRGFRPSDGQASFEAMGPDALQVYDAVAAGGRPVVVYGYSLGAAPALRVAAERPVAAVVLQAPPTSAREAIPKMERSLAWYARPFVRLRASEDVLAWRPQPIDLAPQVTAPLLVLHGTADRIIPASLGRKLLKAAGSERKTFCEVPGAGHEDLWSTGGSTAGPCLERFLREVGP